MNLKNYNISVIGLGYVGLPLAVEFGKTRPVIGFDINTERIAELQLGLDYTLEVSEEELLKAKHLKFTCDPASLRALVEDKLSSIDTPTIFIVTVPTPVDKANRPDLTPLVGASRLVGKILKAGDIVIFESTVYPGCTEEICVPILERESGVKYITQDDASAVPSGFYCGYSPERINPGDKTRRLTNIKKITSGSTPAVARAIDDLYQEIITAGTHAASSIKIAEAAKVIENAQRDLNIAFVNELSMIFNRLDLDTNEVLDAAATKWNFLPFKPGLVGGHCIGIDPYYLTHKAQELGYYPQVILAGRAINDNMSRYAAHHIIRLMIKNEINVATAKIAVLGITFKENCPDVRNSKVIDMVLELQDCGLTVKVYDPIAKQSDIIVGNKIELMQRIDGEKFDGVVVAVPHPEYLSLTPSYLRTLCSNQERPVMADLKGAYDRLLMEKIGFTVFRL